MTDKGEVFQTEGREQRHGSRNAWLPQEITEKTAQLARDS